MSIINSASAHYKKISASIKFFRQQGKQLQTDEIKYQMDYRHSEI
jgi:hypothetical protein